MDDVFLKDVWECHLTEVLSISSRLLCLQRTWTQSSKHPKNPFSPLFWMPNLEIVCRKFILARECSNFLTRACLKLYFEGCSMEFWASDADAVELFVCVRRRRFFVRPPVSNKSSNSVTGTLEAPVWSLESEHQGYRNRRIQGTTCYGSQSVRQGHLWEFFVERVQACKKKGSTIWKWDLGL